MKGIVIGEDATKRAILDAIENVMLIMLPLTVQSDVSVPEDNNFHFTRTESNGLVNKK